MHWLEAVQDRLALQPLRGYGPSDSLATEPSALAGLALRAAGRPEWESVGHWLAELQSDDGSVGVRPTDPKPGWPTSLAILLWIAGRQSQTSGPWESAIARAVRWTIADRGSIAPRSAESGHDSTLVAWSWVEATHAWIEPTAFHVLALKAAGLADHPRTRSAVAMLLDRQLPHGGYNYGNSIVLGSELRPHVQPSGIALLALADERRATEWLAPTVRYLQSQLSPATTTASLSWALLGLSAMREPHSEAEPWLEAMAARLLRSGTHHHRLALVGLAGLHDRTPFPLSLREVHA